MDISLVIPLLNEDESIQELHDWIVKVVNANNLSYEIIFVDDGSTDKSWALIEQMAQQNENVKGIKFRRNYGKSGALNVGFGEVKGDVVFTMDADLQDSPDEIPEMFKMVKEDGFDIVSGWKKKRLDNTFKKNIPSKIYNGVSRIITGIKLHDMNCGLKAYRLDVVKSIEVYGEMHRYIPVIAKSAGFKKIGEKVVKHQERKYGVTKFGLARFVRGPLDLLSISFVSKFGKRPMHFFGGFGTIMFLLGGVIAAYLGGYKLYCMANGEKARLIADMPVFYLALVVMVIGSQFFLTGFLAEMLSRNSQDRNQYIVEKEVGLASSEV